MDARVLGGAFRIAVLILGTAVVMLPFQPAGSAAQVVTVLAGLMGVLFGAAVILAARVWSGRPPLSTGDKSRGPALNEPSRGALPQDREQEGDR